MITRTYSHSGRRGTLQVALFLSFLVVILGVTGCGDSNYLSVRKVPHNPLAGPLNLVSRKGPHPTERSLQTLRRYDLRKVYDDKPEEALARLQDELAAEPTPDKIQALSELAYILAYKADVLGSDAKALDRYGAAVFYAYDYLFDPLYDSNRNPYDPQFRRMCDLYNSGLEAALKIVKETGRLSPGQTLEIDTGAEQIQLDVATRGSWKPEDFERVEFVSDYEITGLTNHHHSFGLGVPLIAVRKPGNPDDPTEQFYPQTLSFPVTAFLRILPGPPGQHAGHARRCVLELHDPMDANTTTVANRLVPLETDLSTALGYQLQKGQEGHESSIATWGLIDPSKVATVEGLYMVEPFDPDKIPVLMVHGLWSSPMTWMEMFNDLLAYPEIRQNYQFWFYLYPTGEPFWFAANKLRNDLRNLRGTLDPGAQNPVFDQMVLVGHSMGGLVSMMQTLDSGNDFWSLLSDRSFDELKADPEIKYDVAQTVFFHPNPSVREFISLGTPYRGSHFANQYTRFLAQKLITLPSRVLWVTQRLRMQNPGLFRDTDLLTISTSIDSLAPDSPILPAMLEAQRAPWVHYHNIVGVVTPKSFWQSILSHFSSKGDGVVAYESAHRDDFQSEIVVDAEHVKIHAHPRSILEVRRILLNHLAELQATPFGQVQSVGYGPAGMPSGGQPSIPLQPTSPVPPPPRVDYPGPPAVVTPVGNPDGPPVAGSPRSGWPTR